MPDVVEIAFSSAQQINDAINNSAPAAPDEANNERNWQIWSIADNDRIDSGQPACYKIYAGVADKSLLTNVINGDICIDTAYELWQRQAGAWVDLGTLKGNVGNDAQITGATASVNSAVGVPSVSVSTTGTPDNQSFDFEFFNLKGEQGDAAGFGTPTASAVTLAPGSSASASVSASGPDNAKVFSFSFGIPQGIQGIQGDPGTGNNWYVGSAITGTSTTPTIFVATGIGDALVGDLYLNSNYSDDTYLGNLYRCTTAGDYTVAKWVYVCNIRGASGSGAGDMTKAQYDPTNSGSVLDSQRLGGELPSYYQINTNGLSAATTFADANYIPMYITSSTSNAKITVANIKSALKNYFDTLYVTAAAITTAIDAAWWVSNYNVSLAIGHLSEEVNVIGHSVNGISVTSSDSTIASVSPHGDSFTVYAQGSGTCTLTVTDTTSMTTKTINVTCTSVPSAVLNDNTPAQIQAAARAGIASQLWSVGDRIGIAMSGTVGGVTLNSARYAYIIGFDHNATVEGTNTIHFQMGFSALSGGVNIAYVDGAYGTQVSSDRFTMNTSATDAGGWAASAMRSSICAQFLAAMPEAWQKVLSGCVKYSDNVGGASDAISNMTATVDKIFLLSQCEAQGGTGNVNPGEPVYQKQYDYYANGNSRVKYKHNATATECEWWLRSVDIRYTDRFRCISTMGGSNPRYGNYSYGFAPAFMVA